MKKTLIVIAVVIALMVGFFIYKSRKPSLTTTTTDINTYTTQNDSSGDPALDADLQDVDKQLSAIDTSSSNADAGLNDQMGDLSSQ